MKITNVKADLVAAAGFAASLLAAGLLPGTVAHVVSIALAVLAALGVHVVARTPAVAPAPAPAPVAPSAPTPLAVARVNPNKPTPRPIPGVPERAKKTAPKAPRKK